VSSVGKLLKIRIAHLREHLGGTVREDEVVLNDGGIGIRDSVIVVKITLGGINVS
jgi:hypothetical protein